jgi:hypothetical protein
MRVTFGRLTRDKCALFPKSTWALAAMVRLAAGTRSGVNGDLRSRPKTAYVLVLLANRDPRMATLFCAMPACLARRWYAT